MNLSDHDLRQLSDEKLRALPDEVVRGLSIKLLNDLKEARERLKQTSKTSSRPPRSDLPWGKPSADEADAAESVADEFPGTGGLSDVLKEKKPAEDEDQPPAEPPVKSEVKTVASKRKPGKQPGAPGYGRQQSLPIDREAHHHPTHCACCNGALTPDAGKAYTGYETLDIAWGQATRLGIHVTVTQHLYYEAACACGHLTQSAPARAVAHELTPDIELSEWRLVGPGLAALIVCLSYRMRLSRPRIREFLWDWLGILLSVGTLNATLHESGAAALPVEDELADAVQNSGLLHADETTWKEGKTLLWLWVFCNAQVAVYWIGYRSAEIIDNVLGADFKGWLMSDGYSVYRHYPKRLRCWAHLLRKAKGLTESLTADARAFGAATLSLLNTLIHAVREAREQPPARPLSETHHAALMEYQHLCEAMRQSTHEKTCALANEMLNDGEAIFNVLRHPEQPLTNNEAERALRHLVILRQISHGTRSETGTRVLAILASVVETCRRRQQSPWVYLATLIEQRRAGRPVPKLLQAVGV